MFSSFISDYGLFILSVLLLFMQTIFATIRCTLLTTRKARLQGLLTEDNDNVTAALAIAEHAPTIAALLQNGCYFLIVMNSILSFYLIQTPLSHFLQKQAFADSTAQQTAFFILALGITSLNILFIERLPKLANIKRQEQLFLLCAPSIHTLAKFFTPIISYIAAPLNFILKLCGVKSVKEPLITEEEIKVLIEQGTQAGTFAEAEQDMVERVFRLADRRINMLMIPRHDVIYLDIEDMHLENKQKIIDSHHSCFPLVRGDLDTIIGIVYAKELLYRNLQEEKFDLSNAIQIPLFIPENVTALNVLELFRKSRTHIALIVDEYGSFQGLITLKDLLETIVGDIPSHNETSEPAITKCEDGSWLLDGMLPVDEMKALLAIKKLPQEEEGGYQTLAGFVITSLGRIPTVSEQLIASHWHFEIIQMDGHRVDKVRVTKQKSRLEITAAL